MKKKNYFSSNDAEILSLMKDRQQENAGGLDIHDERACFCSTCRNSGIQAFKSFIYGEGLAEIKQIYQKQTK